MGLKTRVKKRNKILNRYARIFLVCAVFLGVTLFLPDNYSFARTAPKRANYYLSWEISEIKARELAKWDLLILDMETQVNSLGALKKIKELNPNIVMLVYITPQEIKKDAAVGSSIMRRGRVQDAMVPVCVGLILPAIAAP